MTCSSRVPASSMCPSARFASAAMRASCRSIVASSDAATALRISRATRAGPPFESRYACQRVTSARACQPALWRRRKSRRARVEWALATVQSPCRRATSARASSVSARSWFARSRLSSSEALASAWSASSSSPASMSTRARSRNQTLRETSVSRASASANARSAAGMSPARNSAYPRLCWALNSCRVIPSSAASRALADRSARAARRSRRRRWTAPRLSSTVGRSSGSRSARSATAASDSASATSSRPLRNAMRPLSSWTSGGQVATVAGRRRLRGRGRRRLAALEAVRPRTPRTPA